ncbi:MAG: pirin family protein [Spirochaetia bacterium]|nr:pirin family protein [Spirochaetia bacterium]
MKVIHRADTRGAADHGWLRSRHTFSFADYYEPERMSFGALRVLNDDRVAGGRGFGLHPHENMEIVSIPLKGALDHKDTTGREKVIRSGDVQIMSAGTGLMHSELNHSATEPVEFLQIWVLPQKRDIPPRYEQKTFSPDGRKNAWQVVVSPVENAASLWINQSSWFSLANPEKGTSLEVETHVTGNGLYLFVIEGEVVLEDETLSRRDAVGLTKTGKLTLKAGQDSELLLIEVPMGGERSI